MIATISLGDWGEDSPPDRRVAFAVRIWTDDSEFKVSLLNAAESPWREVEFIGRTLDRAEALQHPWVDDVFHITDHIVAEDPVIKAYLAQEGAG